MNEVWNLDDDRTYSRVVSFEVPTAFTYADMREGKRDKDKRDLIRKAALPMLPSTLPSVKWWAFRIRVNKCGKRPFDIENVPKLIIDAFCTKQIEKDGSTDFARLGLYIDDTIDHVRLMQVYGTRTESDDRMHVEIFGYRQNASET